MDPRIKAAIIAKFSRQSHTKECGFTALLDKYLDSLEANHKWLDFDTIIHTSQWHQLVKILEAGFIYQDNQLVIDALDTTKMDECAIRLAKKFSISDIDYYGEYAITTPPSQEFKQLINDCKKKLTPLVAEIVRAKFVFNADNPEHFTLIMNELTRAIEEGKGNTEKFKVHLKFMEDFYKITQLAVLTIPQTDATEEAIYCQLAEKQQGVTEKLSLCPLSKVQEKLNNLQKSTVNSIADYNKNRKEFALSTQAILKLPKHGKITEIQREAIALDISRILGFDTTQSHRVVYNGSPALFIPFDDIRLLSEFAAGKDFKAFAVGKKYQDYSTIIPVGEGLQADVFIDDFGEALALLYLCSDPDSIGGYNQNKALKNSRSLFIFDQVIMTKNHLALDSRLSLYPVGPMKYTRHGQGRNRTLIEDSSFRHKFNGLFNLGQQKERILAHLQAIINLHKEQIDKLKKQIDTEPPGERKKRLAGYLEQVILLKKDAVSIKKKISERIEDIDKITFAAAGKYSFHILLLEKLLNNPIIFNESGDPYKHPWTDRNEIFTTGIVINNDLITLTFSQKIPGNIVALIETYCPSIQAKENTLTIKSTDLLHINEIMLHPEMRPFLQPGATYLSGEQLSVLANAYKSDPHEKLFAIINKYLSAITKGSTIDKVTLIADTLTRVYSYLDSSGPTHTGLAKHVVKKLHFDIQSRLHQVLAQEEELPENLAQAFSAALKLDRIKAFHKALITAIQTNKLQSPEFKEFLTSCIAAKNRVQNYDQAREQSEIIKQLTDKITENMLTLKGKENSTSRHTFFEHVEEIRPTSNQARKEGKANPPAKFGGISKF